MCLRDAAQFGLGASVGLRITVDEMDRAPKHHVFYGLTSKGLGALFQFGDIEADNGAEILAAGANLRRFTDQA